MVKKFKEMITKLIKIDGYWAVISDEPILKDCLYITHLGNIYKETERPFEEDEGIPRFYPPHYNKLIASQNTEHNLPTITFSDEVAKKLGIVDIKHTVKKYVQELIDCKSVREHERTWISAISHQIATQCLADNADKKFTLEDIEDAIQFGVDKCHYGLQHQTLYKERIINEYIQSLTKEEYSCELEMEETLECRNVFDDNSVKKGWVKTGKFQPKITNNSVIIKRIWK